MMTPASFPKSQLPLMLLPGTLCDVRLFAPIMDRLGSRPVVIGDMFGATTVAELADRLLLQAPPSFMLAGFSLGAIVALEMASRSPQRIAGLAIISGNARAVPGHLHANRLAAVRNVQFLSEYVKRTLWSSYVSPANLARNDLRNMIVAMADDCPPHALEDQTKVALSRIDSRCRLGTIAMPSLVLAGADDAISPPEMQRELADGLVRARLTMIAGAGHFVLLEAPEPCGDALSAWLDRAEASYAASFSTPVEVE